MPKPPVPEKPRPVQEIYDDLKIPEDVVSGVYANTVMVGHTPVEFGLDFITSFIPHVAWCSARVYLVCAADAAVDRHVVGSGGAVQAAAAAGGAAVPPVSPLQPPPPPAPPQGFGTSRGYRGFPEPPRN